MADGRRNKDHPPQVTESAVVRLILIQIQATRVNLQMAKEEGRNEEEEEEEEEKGRKRRRGEARRIRRRGGGGGEGRKE